MPASAQMGTEDGAVKSSVTLGAMARAASLNANVTTELPATIKRENVTVLPDTRGYCKFNDRCILLCII